MEALLLLLLILVVFVLLCKDGGPSRDQIECHTAHTDLKEGYSYLYYIDPDGEMRYLSESCRGCMQGIAEDLKRDGCKVTELHLGNRSSGQL